MSEHLPKIFISITVIAVIAFLAWILIEKPKFELPETGLKTEIVKGLDLPPTAVAVDEWAFVDGNDVYFRSVMGTSTVKIPGAKGRSFVRLSERIVNEDPQVVADCSGVGNYAFYGDSKLLYMNQIWDTPRFQATKIEALREIDRDSFTLTSPTTFTAGGFTYDVKHTVGTTTCRYAVFPR